MVVSRRTVDNHLQRAYTKLGVRGRSELADVLRAEEERPSR
ncbi:MAG: LuxR C-terminal-related transcriptional regulator [Nitriliruptorales bacterium]